MTFIILGIAIAWLWTRESKEICSLCYSKRKMKHLSSSAYLPGFHCEGGCLHVAFITGKPIMKNGELMVEYNWSRD